MNPRNSCHVNPDYAEELHLLDTETRLNQVLARGVPLVLWSALFEPNISTGFKLGHQSVNVLLAHLVELPSQSFVNSL